MGKLFKAVSLALAVALAAVVPVQAEVIDLSAIIGINVTIAGATSLTVETRNVAGDAPVIPMALNFSAANAALPPAGNPWVVSDQYVRVVYSSNYGLWGVRIVTDNEDLEGVDGNDVIDTIAGAVLSDPDGVPNSGDESLSYGGLVIPGNADPSQRAAWAWQVFADIQPVVTSPTSTISVGNVLEDGPTIGDWDDDWIYLADKNDTGYSPDILVANNPDGIVDDLAYGIAVIGGGGGGGSLAQHPAADPKPGDGDVAIYISARFANTNWGGPTPVPFLLPAGSYGASLYVELVHE